MNSVSDIWYDSKDGLRLYARDYNNTNAQATILCLHGLTRNSKDFAYLGEYLSDRYRVIAVDQRGRGASEYDSDPSRYHPMVYVGDVITLLDHLAIERVILIGTSMGGLMSMVLCSMVASRIQAVVLNDIGPDIDPQGLQRIKSYVNSSGSFLSWEAAVAKVRKDNSHEFPRLTPTQWLEFTQNLYYENEQGGVQLACDSAIFRSLNDEQAQSMDLWPFFHSMIPIPTLLIRGASSDILSPDCVEKMKKQKPDLEFVEVPMCGHAPFLNEPESIHAIDNFLSALQGNGKLS
ncbi:MAG: alpha/beta hydrolase [Spongiibacteraceae bacterium]|nr:alpha/beta hydrolase [Spongiibacteraceae bacterium]